MRLFNYRSLELRKQLVLLILIIFIPILFLLLFISYREYQRTIDNIESDVSELIRLFVEEQTGIVNQTRQLLNIISHVPEVHNLDNARCNAFLSDIYRESHHYSTIVVANSQGIIECCAIPLSQPIDVKDRSWFQRVSQSKEFIIDNFIISRSANRASLPFAYPILDGNKFVGAVGAAYDLRNYGSILDKKVMPPGSIIFFVDGNQSILYESPSQEEHIGKALFECRGFHIPDSPKGKLVIEDSDGVKRIYWFERLFAGGESNQLILLVGVSEQAILSGARQMLALNLSVLTGVASFCFAIAWFFGKKRILDPVNHLVERTRQVQRGGLSLSNAWELMPGELSTLAREFDGMLVNVSRREAERDEALTALKREITHHERTVATLREREEHLRILFEQAADAIYVGNPDGSLVKVNQQACRATGYTEEELLIRNVADVDIQIPSPEAFQAFVEEQFHGRPVTIESTHRRKDGSTFPAEITVALLHTQKGPQVLGIARDITERKLVEDLNQVQHNLAAALAATSDLREGLRLCLDAATNGAEVDCGGIYLVDASTGDLNLQVHRGLSPEFVEAVRHFDSGSTQTKLVMAGRRYYGQFEEIIKIPAEAERIEGLRFLATIPLRHEGRSIGCLNVASHTVEDISPQMCKGLETIAAEATQAFVRLQAEDALRASEERFRTLVKLAPVPMAIFDQNGNISFLNDRYIRLFGYTLEDIPTVEALWPLAFPDQDHRCSVLERWGMTVEKASLDAAFIDPAEYHMTSRDGTVRIVEVSGLVLGDEWLACFIDLTERKQAELSLRSKEATLRGILDATKESIFQFSRDGIIRMANETAAKRLGASAEEIIGQHYSRFMTPQLARSRQVPLTRVLESGMPVEYEDERSGILFDHTFYPVLDADGLVTSIVAYSRDITERKRASRELERALVKYRALFDCFPLGITVSDPNGSIVESNREAERLLGLPAEEHLGLCIDAPEWTIVRPDGSLMPPDEFASVRALREQRPVENIEMGIIKPAGETIWVSVTAAPIPLPEYGVVITYGDISARRGMEEALREREEIFSSIVGQAVDAIVLLDPGGRFVEFNVSAHEGLGYTREEFAALRVMDIQAEHSPGLIRQNLQRVQMQGASIFETKHRHRGGEIRDVRVSIKPLRIRDQDFFAVVWTDITERKRADEELRFHKTILEETGHIAKVGGWHFDAVTGKGFWTDEVARIHDLDPSLPTSVDVGIRYYVGESRTKIEAAINDAVERGHPYDLELEMVSAKGVPKWVRTIGHPIVEHGRVIAVQGSFQDISDHKRAEDALRHSLEEKVVLLKEVHHRVKNNLQIVASLLGLQAGRSDNEQVVSVLADTRNRVKAMALLHETLYRSENLARINFATYLKDLCGKLLLSHSSTASRVRMQYSIAEISLPLEQAVPCGLIVSELVSNALKHAFPGVRSGRIFVSLESNEEQLLVLSVQDDGIGLASGLNPAGGSTLGLQLVSGLVRQLGGHMDIAGSTGPGAALRIAFPLPKDK